MLDKDKEERRLKKVKIALMRNPQFALWSGIMMVGKTTLDENFPSAMTNGRDEVYGREFVKGLDDKELAFVVLHENLHKAFRHLFIWRKLWEEDAQLANMACDYVINLMLVEMDKANNVIAMPMKEGKVYGLLDERFKGMNAKQVFDILKQEKKDDPDKFGGSGDGFDEHDWENAKELSADEKKELEREIDQALRQGQINHAKLHGKGGNGLSREIGELLEPKVDWREVLREFVTSVCSAKDTSSWRRPNRRYLGNDVYMPTLIGERVGHLAIGIDTSGSVGGKELNDFLTEVKGIAELVNPEKVDLIYWDGEVAGHEEYDNASVSNIVSSTQPKGGGGTDPTSMMRYMKEKNIKPEAIIMLTDGYIGDWGNEWEAPMLWTICGGNDAYAPNGKTIHIKD
jgi:predicted metal-dependent peptidase